MSEHIMKFTVSVIIPNWNGVHLMGKHLAQIIAASPQAEIIVADDASSDGSVVYLKKNFPTIHVVARTKREGFAANVNSGVAAATGDIVVLLNTDVEPEKRYLLPLLNHFSAPNVFAVGCLEKSHEPSGVVRRGRGLGRWYRGFYIHEKGKPVKSTTAWVSGGSGAFRRSMWNALGGMDTIYNPFYWEDIDLSYRARKSGWETVFEPESVVHHYHEEGKIKREFSPSEVKKIVYRNQFIFIWKNSSEMRVICAHILWLPVRLIQAVIRSDWLMLHGFIAAVFSVFAVRAKRRVQHGAYTRRDTDLDIVN